MATPQRHERTGRDERTPVDLHREQIAETQRLGTDVGVGFTRGQTRGIVGGALGVGLVGALLFLPVGFISWGVDVGLGPRLLVAAVIGFLAGAAVGAVYWGGRRPELDGEAVGTEGIGHGEPVHRAEPDGPAEPNSAA